MAYLKLKEYARAVVSSSNYHYCCIYMSVFEAYLLHKINRTTVITMLLYLSINSN